MCDIKACFDQIPAAAYALIGALGGTGLTAFFNYLNNVKLKKTEYDNAFYQKLTDERFAFYRDLEQALIPIIEVFDSSEGMALKVVLNQESFDKAFRTIQLLNIKSDWFEPQTRSLLNQITQSLADIRNELTSERSIMLDERAEIGVKYWPILSKLTVDLLESLHSDYYSLHDIKTLISRRAKQK